MYEVVSWLLEIFSAMFQGYCLQYFFGSFLEGRLRDRRINGLAAAVLYGILRLGTGFFFTKGLHEFLGFRKAGSNPGHRIDDCASVL